MNTKLLILDSGAFSVWASGAFSKKKATEKNLEPQKIDLEKYIQFCHDHPKCSYFVNLDVIPGRPRDKRSMTVENVERACIEGWDNYNQMIQELPKDKVIPVFHQGDRFEWLDHYLNHGVKYIGISPANDKTVGEKMKWLGKVKKFIFDGAGRPLVKTHGFAVTTYHLMKYWQWYSVDSASWKLWASWGIIYVPVSTGGEFDYSKPPLIVATSPCSKKYAKRQEHILSASPALRERIEAYLETCGMVLGDYKIRKEAPGYKLVKGIPGEGEVWYKKDKQEVLEPLEWGVMTSFQARCVANVKFMFRAAKVLPVKHIYFAGAPMPYELETQMGKRLLSYHEIGKCKTLPNPQLQRHFNVM